MTRRRRFVHLDRDTGLLSLREFEAPDDLSFAERVRHSEASILEQLSGPVEHAAARLVCDGCGRAAPVDLRDPVAPAGWREVEGRGDLCPTCQGRP